MRGGVAGNKEIEPAMMSFEEARETILSHVDRLETERVELLESLGRVTAEDIIAPFNLPSFDNSSMDGYAVRAADCGSHASLPIEGYIPAGGVATFILAPGTAIKIMTGAPVPKDCDAVVPFEDAEEAGQQIVLKAKVRPDQHIRRAGEDVRRGDTVIPSQTPIRASEINMLASLGRSFVEVYRRPVVAILSTGDELVEPGQPLAEGQIYNSNSVMLAAAVREAGAIPLVLGIARDDRECLRQKIREGLAADALITAAGVSVGDRDFVREILTELGVKQILWKVNIKPGKSATFGIYDGKPVFSLPGNPVSALITFEELARPALMKMMGRRQFIQSLLTATLQEDLRKQPGKIFFARVRLRIAKGKLLAWSAGHQDTGFQRTICLADGIALLPAERGHFHAGEEIEVHLFSGMLNLAEATTGER
jgi:molybdopterin molybdotransferase